MERSDKGYLREWLPLGLRCGRQKDKLYGTLPSLLHIMKERENDTAYFLR